MIGQNKYDIDTPALLIDLDKMETNLATMAEFFKGKKAQLRPHIKTHKCPILAHKQLALGAKGITCAKLGEAEVMVSSGVIDILIANEIVTSQKILRLASLAKHANITVAVDGMNNVCDLEEACKYVGSHLGILVDVDLGMKRCGVRSPQEALVLCQAITESCYLELRGLMGYEGHLVMISDKDERENRVITTMDYMRRVKDYIESHGIEIREISCGGTGTYDITGVIPIVTEIQAGSYIFMDNKYHNICSEFKCALTLLTSIISRPSKGCVILDAGKKAITEEFGMPIIMGYDEARITGLNEEHGIVTISNDSAALLPGNKVEIVPTHACTTVNLHDNYVAVRGDRVEAVWPISARGMYT